MTRLLEHTPARPLTACLPCTSCGIVLKSDTRKMLSAAAETSSHSTLELLTMIVCRRSSVE